jgi:hypothetical protein
MFPPLIVCLVFFYENVMFSVPIAVLSFMKRYVFPIQSQVLSDNISLRATDQSRSGHVQQT